MKTSVVLAAALTAMNTANAAVIPFFDGELSINYDAHSGWSFGFDKQPAQSGSPPATTTPGSGSGSTTTPATTADDGDDDEGGVGWLVLELVSCFFLSPSSLSFGGGMYTPIIFGCVCLEHVLVSRK